MESHTGTDGLPADSSQALISSLLNGTETASSLASSLAQLPDAKNFLSQILAGNQLSPGSGSNLQQVLSAAAAVSLVTQQPHQRLPTLKPTTSSPSHSQVVTTPTQPTPTAGRKRGRPPAADQEDSLRKRKGGYSSSSRGGGEKQSKGLRHFSQLVCEKVREKGITSYNEVADELVRELDEQCGNEMQIDQKNIRRRVYDALNVLMAMNIISKEKKEIRWIGLPTNSVQECEHIQTELSQFEERISRKKSELHELVLQILTLKNLMKRNKEHAESGAPPTPNSAIGLPFILVNTSKNTVIDCSISSDKSEYVFNFDNTFELHQDVDILKRMGLDCGLHSGACTSESLTQAKSLLPKMLGPVLDEMAEISALSATIIPQSPQHESQPGPSTPSTPVPRSTTTTVHTPLLSDVNNGPTYSSSPLGTVPYSTLNNSPGSIAAAISTLQHLQQLGGQSSSTGSPGSHNPLSTGATLLPPSSSSLPTSGVTLPGISVTARPLSLSTKTPSVPLSPLIKTQIPLSSVSNNQGRSPGTKVVTVQPLPGNASVADFIASLQQNVSTLLKQQQGTVSTTPSFSSLLNGLQSSPLSQQNSQKKLLMSGEHSTVSSPGKFLTQNPTT